MAVYADEKQRTFTLQTKNTTYQMKVDAYGMLLHTYYGEKTDNSDLSYRIPMDDRGFSGYAYEASCADDRLSSDLAPQEYSCFGTGDYRISALRVRNENGSQAVTLCYAGYELSRGNTAFRACRLFMRMKQKRKPSASFCGIRKADWKCFYSMAFWKNWTSLQGL